MNTAETQADAFGILFFENNPSYPGMRQLRGTLYIEDNATWSGHDRQVEILGWIESKNGDEHYRLLADGYSGTMSDIRRRPGDKWCYDFEGAAGPDHEFCINGWKFKGDEHTRPHILLWFILPPPRCDKSSSLMADRSL